MITNPNRLKNRRNRTGGAHRRTGITALENDVITAIEVGSHNAQGHRHRFNGLLPHLAVHVFSKGLAAQSAAGENLKRPIRNSGLFHGFGDVLQLRAVFATGIQRCHQTARRGAGYQHGPDARFFQHLNDADMGKAPCSTATQSQADARQGFDHGRRRWRRHHRHFGCWCFGGGVLALRFAGRCDGQTGFNARRFFGCLGGTNYHRRFSRRCSGTST